MNCIKHQETAAVSQCSECGAGMCSECIDASEYRINNKPMCQNCNLSYVNYLLEEDRKTKKWTLIKLIANGFFIILGLIIWVSGGDIMGALFIFALGGIPTAWKIFSTSDKEKLENKYDDDVADIKYGEGSGLMNSVIRFAMRVVFTVVVGAVAAPILLGMNIWKFVKCTKNIKANEIRIVEIAAR
jgi:hypothetical protein